VLHTAKTTLKPDEKIKIVTILPNALTTVGLLGERSSDDKPSTVGVLPAALRELNGAFEKQGRCTWCV
jgi:hypothetical protein